MATRKTPRCAYCAWCVPAATHCRRTTKAHGNAFGLKPVCPLAAMQPALCGRRMSTRRHWVEDLAACSGGTVTGAGRCGDGSVCYLLDAAEASIRAASASTAVHLACFQRCRRYPPSICVLFNRKTFSSLCKYDAERGNTDVRTIASLVGSELSKGTITNPARKTLHSASSPGMQFSLGWATCMSETSACIEMRKG